MDADDSELAINKKGTGINLNWKALVGIVAVVIGATTWCVNTTTTAEAHTLALSELKTDFHNMAAKVDALLIDRGINPNQVQRETNAGHPQAAPDK